MNVWTSTVLATLGTTLVYGVGRRIYARRPSILTLPIVVTAAVIGVVLSIAHVDVASYTRAARPLSWLLGPATIALAVPLHRNRELLRRRARTILVSVSVGALIGLVSAVLLARALGLPRAIQLSIAPKSVTTPIAMPIAERLGGIPTLTAAIVVLTGTFGLAFGGRLLTRFRVTQPVARGLALGTSTHAIGTVQALSESAESGAASAVALVIAGIVTALAAPWFVPLLL